ncbi:MAG: hypothetical protein RB191_21160 [Terriglobia bacterium]|nr:hypothetical protein [Terriglobia bacterium]
MFRWLALTAVFSVLVANTMLCQNRQPSTQPASSKEWVCPESISIDSYNHFDQSNGGRAEQPRGWRRFMAWPEGITAWAIILTLGAITWQSFETHRAATASRNAASAALEHANHIVASERAWVLVERVTMTSGGIDRPEGIQQVFIHCAARNYGKTPARVLGLNALLAEGPISDPEATWNDRLYDFTQKSTPTWVITPNHAKALHDSVPGFFANPDEILHPPEREGNAHFIHGVIRYWDMFSESDRLTRFCYRWDKQGAPLGEGWHVAGAERCNQET